ncbi:MAG: cyclopropane-fatty-acyl-phospholipid synthase family protein [Burkholderiales bacterium]
MRPPFRRLIERVARSTGVPFRVVFADGSGYRHGQADPAFTLVFRDSSAQWRAVRDGHIGFLEAYFDGGLDVDGDFAALFRAGMEAGVDAAPTRWVRLKNAWLERRSSNRTFAQARANARRHYGLPREFYRWWLDEPAMMYTCAYWPDGTTTLEDAQRAKMDHVCRKVRLAAGERFVDVGTGWGGLLFHAWERYGALGTGINTTTEQVADLRAEIARRRLEDRISVVECDFRAIPGTYDKLLSVGTLEHAGRDQLPQVIRAHADALKPGGLGVIHFIGHVGVRDTEYFIRRHVFPGGWIPSLTLALDQMERHGLEVLDVENLRRHYALTLDCWAERFERRWPEIRAIDPRRFDERFRRVWRTYLVGCAEMFRSPTGRTHLFQVTVAKGNVTKNYPMSRDFLYRRSR